MSASTHSHSDGEPSYSSLLPEDSSQQEATRPLTTRADRNRRCLFLVFAVLLSVRVFCTGKAQSRATRLLQVLLGIEAFYLPLLLLLSCCPSLQRGLLYCHRIRKCWLDLSDLSAFGIAENARSVEIEVLDAPGTPRIGAWHLAPEPEASHAGRDAQLDAALRSGKWPVILFCHGQAGDRGTPGRLATAKKLAQELRAHVLLFDYRGFGDTAGQFAPSQASMVQDACAVYDWLALGTGSQAIVVFGQSMGAAVAVQLVAKLEQRDRLTPSLQSMILDVPFRNASSAIYNHPLGLPLLPFGSACIEALCSHTLHDTWASDETIGLLKCPLLTISAGRDIMVSSQAGRELCDIAKEENKGRICMHVYLPEARHSDSFKHDPWIERVKLFVSGERTAMEMVVAKESS